MENNNKSLVEIQSEVSRELANQETMSTLLATTFKGLKPENVKLAIVEGMIRGFTFRDFLERNIYAIPYGDKYSLVTSIDNARKIGMASGVVGVTEPAYEEKEGRVVSCVVTVKRLVNEHVGEFTAKVYMAEFSTGKNLWVTKPRMMLAKVAEMHALRKACPKELSQSYVEEEMDKEVKKAVIIVPSDDYGTKLEAAKTLEELQSVWASIPAQAKKDLMEIKDAMKESLAPKVSELKQESHEGAQV